MSETIQTFLMNNFHLLFVTVYFLVTLRFARRFFTFYLTNSVDMTEIKDTDSKKSNHKEKVSLDKTVTNEMK